MALALVACAPPGVADFDSIPISVGDQELDVALADTSEERRQGLADLEVFPGDVDGMLFSWEAATPATFTMEDTMFPLDIWWFDAAGVLVGSTSMEPCPDGSCVDYRAPEPVLWALETASGEYDFPPGALLSTVEND